MASPPGTKASVLVVEDDDAIRRGLEDALRFAGFAASGAADGTRGLDLARRGAFDLVLLDVRLPGLDGFQVLHALRRDRPLLPVILLTARGAEEDRVRGLRGGADDYVVKPFSPAELLARIDAVLRRSAERPAPIRQVSIAGRRIDFERREVRLPDGGRKALSERDTDLLLHLATHRGRAVSREELLRCVWGVDPRGLQTRTVDMAVARLRETLADAGEPQVVLTVRAKGYMLGDADADPADGAVDAGTESADGAGA